LQGVRARFRAGHKARQGNAKKGGTKNNRRAFRKVDFFGRKTITNNGQSKVLNKMKGVSIGQGKNQIMSAITKKSTIGARREEGIQRPNPKPRRVLEIGKK